MDLTEYVDTLRSDLAKAARAMGPETEEVAGRLGVALESSVRLALMDALSHAAAEVTTELDGMSVEVRLQGREPVFVVVGSAHSVPDDRPAPEETEPLDDEDGETARITLRLPESLKGRAEERAYAKGQSLNTWIVNAVRSATALSTAQDWVTGLTSAATSAAAGDGRNRRTNKRVQGWVR